MAFPVERYDANTKSHPHFQCDRCGGVYDMDLPYRADLDEEALAHSEHQVTRHELLFHGICAGCKTLH